MNLHKLIFVNNNCYKRGRYMTPSGIVVHSTGANNPNLRRYVGPDDGLLGVNTNNNHWNMGGLSVCVNAFIGKLKDGTIATYQTLPWNMKPWGCASGPKGSYNNSHIQFEICEDSLNDRTYFDKVYKEAVELCAYLCKMYNIKVSSIVCHSEAHSLGYASNHGDVMHWFPKHGKNMDIFRSDVQKLINSGKDAPTPQPQPTPSAPQSNGKLKTGLYLVISEDGMNVRSGPGTSYDIVKTVSKGEAFTMTQFSGDWGRLKSEEGWINCNPIYCQFVSGGGQTTSKPQQSFGVPFLVRVTEPNGLNIRKGPGKNYGKVGAVPCGPKKYTIVEVNGDWGLLKSYAKDRNGWICLTGYTEHC